MLTLINLEQPQSWPAQLMLCLETNYEIFDGWERCDGSISGPRFDAAISELAEAIKPYGMIGWHCTRLTDKEIESICRSGMQLPNQATLHARVDALTLSGKISNAIAERLKLENRVSDKNRAGMIWFCFFPPRIAGESGIGRLFRHWGGEALYVCHERDSETSPILSQIGVPCIIEANIPIASLASNSWLPRKIARRYLISCGLRTLEPTDHEDRIETPLAAEHVRRVIRYPEPDFIELTGCASWKVPVGQRSPTGRESSESD